MLNTYQFKTTMRFNISWFVTNVLETVIKTDGNLEKLNDVTNLIAARRRQLILLPSFLTNYYKIFYFRQWLQSYLILALLGPDPRNFLTQFYVFSQTRLVIHAIAKYVNDGLPVFRFVYTRPFIINDPQTVT